MAGALVFWNRSARVAALTALACVSAGLGACSSVDSVQLSAVGDATAASSARMRVSFFGDGEELSYEGVADFETGASRLVTSREKGKGVVSVSVGNESFIGLLEPPASGPAWIRLGGAADGESDGTPARALDPSTFVEQLRDSSAELTESGKGRVRGVRTTTYKVTLSGTDATKIFDAFGPAKGRLDVDAEGRLRLFEVTPTKNGEGDEPELFDRLTYELWDFGVEVDVDIPAERIVDFGDPAAGKLLDEIYGGSGAGTDLDEAAADDFDELENLKLTGPFAQIAAGSWQAANWSVWEAPTTMKDIYCTTFELDPRPLADTEFPDIPGDISHGDYASGCAPRADLFKIGDPLRELATAYTGDYWYFAGTAAPEFTNVEFTFTNGEKQTVPIDPASHVFVLFNQSNLKLKQLRPTGELRSSIKCVVEKEFGSLICSGTHSR